MNILRYFQVRVISGLLAVGAMMSGCAITEVVQPVADLNTEQVCIIEAPAVRPGFLTEYVRQLERKGYRVLALKEGSAKNACEVTSTYLARWSWDLALYMSLAEINVYRYGRVVGSARYDSRKGGGRVFEKFIDAETKIEKIVGELFPDAAS